jgi:hypothetical protein
VWDWLDAQHDHVLAVDDGRTHVDLERRLGRAHSLLHTLIGFLIPSRAHDRVWSSIRHPHDHHAAAMIGECNARILQTPGLRELLFELHCASLLLTHERPKCLCGQGWGDFLRERSQSHVRALYAKQIG